jgi:hypothetical protein
MVHDLVWRKCSSFSLYPQMKSTLHPQNFGYTPKNEGKRVHVLPDEKTFGHTLSHIPLYYTMFNSCRHLGLLPDLPDTIVKGDYCGQVWFQFARWLQRRRSLNVFLQRSNVNESCNVGLILDLLDVIMKGDHPRTIVTKFGSSWPSSLYGEDL